MDFVVIGLGLSALALLTGLALLCLVAPHWFRKAGAAHPGEAAYAQAQAGERRALGQGFLCAGAVLLLTTGGGISAGLTDKSGAYLIATMATLAILGLFGWDLLYRRQHPIPARRRPAPTRATRAGLEARAEHPAKVSSNSLAPTQARRRILPARQRVAATTLPAVAMNAPEDARDAAEVTTDSQQASSQEAVEDEAQEPVASDLPVTMSQDPEPEAGLPPDTTMASSHEGDEVEETDAVADATDTEEFPEPGPLEVASANGAAEPEQSGSPFAEPETPHQGDDRVIALFPTAAAQRSRTMIAPTDSNGQS